jgi:hypothetical protein
MCINRNARRLEASWAAAANLGVRAAPTAQDAAARWMTEAPTTSRRGKTNMMSPAAPGLRGGGDTLRVRAAKGGPRVRGGAGSPGIPERPPEPARGRRVDEYRRVENEASQKGGKRGSGRGVGRGRGRGWEEAEGGLRRGVDTRPSSNTAPACRDKVVARRPLQGEASAGERVIGVTREDGSPAIAPEGGGVRRPDRQAQAEASG